MVFFFKQKTAYEMRISDWSSDVCSSDLKRRIFRRRAWTSTPSSSSVRPPALPKPMIRTQNRVKSAARNPPRARPKKPDRFGNDTGRTAAHRRGGPFLFGLWPDQPCRSGGHQIGRAHV